MAATRSHPLRTGRSGDRAPPPCTHSDPPELDERAQRPAVGSEAIQPVEEVLIAATPTPSDGDLCRGVRGVADSGWSVASVSNASRSASASRPSRSATAVSIKATLACPMPVRAAKAVNSARAASKSSRSPCRRDELSTCRTLEHPDPSDRVGAQHVCHAPACGRRRRRRRNAPTIDCRPPALDRADRSARPRRPRPRLRRWPVHGRSDHRYRPVAGSDRDQRGPPVVVGAHVEHGPHELAAVGSTTPGSVSHP